MTGPSSTYSGHTAAAFKSLDMCASIISVDLRGHRESLGTGSGTQTVGLTFCTSSKLVWTTVKQRKYGFMGDAISQLSTLMQ